MLGGVWLYLLKPRTHLLAIRERGRLFDALKPDWMRIKGIRVLDRREHLRQTCIVHGPVPLCCRSALPELYSIDVLFLYNLSVWTILLQKRPKVLRFLFGTDSCKYHLSAGHFRLRVLDIFLERSVIPHNA